MNTLMCFKNLRQPKYLNLKFKIDPNKALLHTLKRQNTATNFMINLDDESVVISNAKIYLTNSFYVMMTLSWLPYYKAI